MSIGKLRERPTAFHAVISEKLHQRPKPTHRLPFCEIAEYAYGTPHHMHKKYRVLIEKHTQKEG